MVEQGIETTVKVDYRNRDGWHVFTSQDVHGLYVASKDSRAAYDDVLLAVKRLMELDFSCDCTVTRPMSFEDFEAAFVNGDSRSELSPNLRTEALFVKGRRSDLAAASL